MIIFKVEREQYGWTIRTGDCMSTPFWSRDVAIREANGLADAIRRHGECARVTVQGVDDDQSRGRIADSNASLPNASGCGGEADLR